MNKIKISGIIPESIVDGPGIRYTVFSQGCNHFCKGCHNPQTHDLNGGKEYDIEDIIKDIKKNPLLMGVTFSGGEPFLQARQFACLAKLVRNLGLNIVTYTGYKFEDLIKGFDKEPGWKDLLENTDILIDGPYEQKKRNLILKFRGSENQRILDVKESLANKKAIEKVI